MRITLRAGISGASLFSHKKREKPDNSENIYKALYAASLENPQDPLIEDTKSPNRFSQELFDQVPEVSSKLPASISAKDFLQEESRLQTRRSDFLLGKRSLTGFIRVLVTGSGGPAAIAVLRSLHADKDIILLSADMDPWASGLYLVDSCNRIILLPAKDPQFVDNLLELCRQHRVDILIPTVDAELMPIASNLNRFKSIGTRVLGAPLAVLERTIDKLALAQSCKGTVRVPRTELVLETDINSWKFPVIIKPRRGSGSRGVLLLQSAADLPAKEFLQDVMIQEYLPGDEYSIDVLASKKGNPIAAVPRLRARIDSGVAVAGRTLVDAELTNFAKNVVSVLRLPFISNVQVRRGVDGNPYLLEVNPRVPGSLALTKAAGVDMVRLAVNDLRGLKIPKEVAHREVAMLRPLEDLIIECDDLENGTFKESVIT